MKHTPGKWHVSPGPKKVGYVYAADCVVAKCGDFTDGELVKYCGERWNADAQLISQAPAMLEALKELLDGVMKLPPLTAIVGVLELQCNKARAVIAAAEDSPERR